jgi:hypothetical protein
MNADIAAANESFDGDNLQTLLVVRQPALPQDSNAHPQAPCSAAILSTQAPDAIAIQNFKSPA